MRFLSAFTLTACAILALACGEPPSREDHVLVERQKFAVELLSWAPVGEAGLALDLQVRVTGKSDLGRLTVEVRQVGPAEEVLRVDPVALDVAGMGFDDQRTVTVSVTAAEDVMAVAVVLESVPSAERRESYPELAGS